MPHAARTVVILAPVLVFASACGRPAASPPVDSDTPPHITLNLTPSGSGTVDVIGVPPDDLSRLQQHSPTQQDEWTALLRVAVSGDADVPDDRPPVLGTYSISGRAIRFTPQFPFDPGRRYQVVFDAARLPTGKQTPQAGSANDAIRLKPDPTWRSPAWRSQRIEATVSIPAAERHATTRVVEVYPTVREVPENQLRLYIYFSAPMGLQGGFDYIHLLDEAGRPTRDPFLPLDVNLWNANRTRYTVLFDPGRVKRGVLPNEQLGRSLIKGRKYTLLVDESWRDAEGQPLAAAFRREFRVGPPDEHPIDPAMWRLDAPSEGTRDPLTVSFPTSLDYALMSRALSVSADRGNRVEGDIRIEAAETRWVFTPREPWRSGGYVLIAASILEDVAGNRIGRPFEADALTTEAGERQAQSAALPFRPRSRER